MTKTLKKSIRYLDRGEDILIFLFCICIFLIGAYALYDSYLVYQHANDTSILKYKPGYDGETPQKPIKGNMVAWLTLDDTKVDYPVMQGDNNEEYLNTDPFGDYALSGSIFLDYRNKPDFSDGYSLIYGHHMEQNAMFGALDLYTKQDYFNSHKSGKLILNDDAETAYNLKVFAVTEADASNENVFAPTVTDVSATMYYIKQNAIYLDEEALNDKKETDKLVGLSTCKYPDTTDRTIVFCIMSNGD